MEIPILDEGRFEELTISGQLRVIERAVGGQPAILMGSSLGGYLAALYASPAIRSKSSGWSCSPLPSSFRAAGGSAIPNRNGSAGSAKAPPPFFTTAMAGNGGWDTSLWKMRLSMKTNRSFPSRL